MDGHMFHSFFPFFARLAQLKDEYLSFYFITIRWNINIDVSWWPVPLVENTSRVSAHISIVSESSSTACWVGTAPPGDSSELKQEVLFCGMKTNSHHYHRFAFFSGLFCIPHPQSSRLTLWLHCSQARNKDELKHKTQNKTQVLLFLKKELFVPAYRQVFQFSSQRFWRWPRSHHSF